MAQILIDQNDNNKTFNAKLNDIITVTLEENPTTGYQWRQDAIEKNIILENSQYHMHSNSAIGGGGIRIFNFRTKSTGKAEVRLSLVRDWEKPIHPIDQFVIFMQIIRL